MLVKLTPRGNFINVLRAAYTLPDPDSAKRQESCQSFFTFSGSAQVKSAHKMLVKLAPHLYASQCRTIDVNEQLNHFLLGSISSTFYRQILCK